MNAPHTAREALILEALGELDGVLPRVEDLCGRMEASARSLDAAGAKYGEEIQRFTGETKQALAEHVQRRVTASTIEALATHRKAMQEAATLAFAEQLAPMVRDIARQLEQQASAVAAPAGWTQRWRWGLAAFVVGAGASGMVGWLLLHR